MRPISVRNSAEFRRLLRARTGRAGEKISKNRAFREISRKKLRDIRAAAPPSFCPRPVLVTRPKLEATLCADVFMIRGFQEPGGRTLHADQHEAFW
jgi:hypothetical protein